MMEGDADGKAPPVSDPLAPALPAASRAPADPLGAKAAASDASPASPAPSGSPPSVAATPAVVDPLKAFKPPARQREDSGSEQHLPCAEAVASAPAAANAGADPVASEEAGEEGCKSWDVEHEAATETVAADPSADADRSASPSGEASAVLAQHYDLADDSDDEVSAPPKPEERGGPGMQGVGRALAPSVDDYLAGNADVSTSAPSAADVAVSPADLDLAAEVRNRFLYLTPEDQQTVCRRECQRAQKAEEALLKQLQQTIDKYSDALDTARAVRKAIAAGACTDAEELAAAGSMQGEAAREAALAAFGLSPELEQKYEARVSLLQEALVAIRSEPMVSLPKLSAMETVKGFALGSYARGAHVANQIQDREDYNYAVGFAKGAMASLSSRFRRSNTGGVARTPSSGDQAGGTELRDGGDLAASVIAAMPDVEGLSVPPIQDPPAH